MTPSHCSNGACIECSASEVRCNTNHDGLETCDPNGHWQPGMSCVLPQVCVDPGQCGDVPEAGAGR
jgi:hypothetical protein